MGVCDHNNNTIIIMVTHTTLHTCVPHYTHNVCDVVCNNNNIIIMVTHTHVTVFSVDCTHPIRSDSLSLPAE